MCRPQSSPAETKSLAPLDLPILALSLERDPTLLQAGEEPAPLQAVPTAPGASIG